MPINVVCPGCYKRFQVNEKFAGKKGPCPNCKTIIDIPKEQVLVHAPDEFVSGGKTVKGRTILKPLTRLNTDFQTVPILLGTGGFLLVLALAILLGLPSLGLGLGLRNIIGFFGLFLVAFPLVFFGQRLFKDPDDLNEVAMREILRKCGICSGAYALLWICFEFLARYMQADGVFIWIYLVPFAVFSIFVTHVVFDFDLVRGMLHYLIFFVPLVLFRGLMGLGWIWNAVVEITTGPGNAPPPPPTPGI